MVTFLDNDKTAGVASVSVNAPERIAALRAWLPTLPEVPLVPLEALDRELKLAQYPSVQFFLIGYLNISATQLEKLSSWGLVVHIASLVTDMVEQLLLPRYAASSLEAQ